MLDSSIQSIIDAFSENIAIADERGDIVAVNVGWRRFGDQTISRSPSYCVNTNYLAVLDDGEVGAQVRRGFLDMVSGRKRSVFNRVSVPQPHREALVPAHHHALLPRRGQLFPCGAQGRSRSIEAEHALENILLPDHRRPRQHPQKKDPYTSGHQRRTALLSTRIARDLGLPARTVLGVWFGGLIHDVGKIYVPAEVLNRPGRLSRLELELIREHPLVGWDIVHHIEFPWPVAATVLQHHERLDGSGYRRASPAMPSSSTPADRGRRGRVRGHDEPPPVPRGSPQVPRNHRAHERPWPLLQSGRRRRLPRHRGGGRLRVRAARAAARPVLTGAAVKELAAASERVAGRRRRGVFDTAAVGPC